MKTVYILGAGFSIDAGAPSQANIMKEAFKLYENNKDGFPRFQIFKEFLINEMNFSEEQFSNVILEDIFTPLDRCLSDNLQYRGMSISEIMKTRENAFHIIGDTIKHLIQDKERNRKYIDKFAKHLVEKSKERMKIREVKGRDVIDPVSVISTNWDIILDNSIYKEINNTISNEETSYGVVDYCCYISSLDEEDDTVKPGLYAIGKGGYNVKLLKLHGSLNWLQCPRCMRLYTGFERKIALDHNNNCRHCDKNFGNKGGNILTSNLIMPTFIKDLSNPQYKIIWQNAGIEISEADKLVFIGYSLPSADFEIRQLLSRMSRVNVKIEVVDFLSQVCDVETRETKKNAIKSNWTNFFGKRDISFHFDGAKSYIDENF